MQGMMGALMGVASIAGPLIGGGFTSNVTWRWCFWLNLPLGAAAMVVIYLFLDIPDREETKLPLVMKLKQLDAPGTTVLVPGVVCLLLALQWGGQTYSVSSSYLRTFCILHIQLTSYSGAMDALRHCSPSQEFCSLPLPRPRSCFPQQRRSLRASSSNAASFPASGRLSASTLGTTSSVSDDHKLTALALRLTLRYSLLHPDLVPVHQGILGCPIRNPDPAPDVVDGGRLNLGWDHQRQDRLLHAARNHRHLHHVRRRRAPDDTPGRHERRQVDRLPDPVRARPGPVLPGAEPRRADLPAQEGRADRPRADAVRVADRRVDVRRRR